MYECRRSSPLRGTLLTAVLLVSIAGCGSAAVDPAATETMKGIAGLYFDYAYKNASKMGPPDANKLKAHGRSMDALTAGSAGVDVTRLDEYFVSPRDKQPLVILFNVPVTNIGRGAPLVAHEQTGVKGKKLVAYANGKVEELDDVALKQAIEGKAPNG
jgi:hypothetical protein